MGDGFNKMIFELYSTLDKLGRVSNVIYSQDIILCNFSSNPLRSQTTFYEC